MTVVMPKDAVDKALAGMRSGSRLHFSQRCAVEMTFEEYCRTHGVAVCILNFLSWLVTTDTGRDVVRALSRRVVEVEAEATGVESAP